MLPQQRKTGILTSEEQAQYDDILSKKPLQRQSYQQFLEQLGELKRTKLNQRCQKLGFNLDFETGQVRYSDSFEPLKISYDLWFVRHGKTEGNTEPRVYQGQVDYENNQLNQIGLQQAEDAADKMDDEVKRNGWLPDLIVYSPLTRAKQTGEAFAKRHPEVPVVVRDGIVEMAFGDWDNVRVIDVPHDSIGHLFYLDQNAVVVASDPHVVREGVLGLHSKVGAVIPAESFIDVLERLSIALYKIEQEDKIKSIKDRKPRILMYGHSMAGAAILMLLGHGRSVEAGQGNGLGFDGKYIMPNATPTFLQPKKPTVFN